MSYDFTPCDGWDDAVDEDAKTVAALMGIEIERVYFSGFSSQGDGACFEGRLGYRKGCVPAVMRYAPKDSCLHKIAKDWRDVMRKTFYRASGTVEHSGRYMHEHSTRFYFDDLPMRIEDELKEVARRLMRWIYAQLEKEYDYARAWEAARQWQEANDELRIARIARRKLISAMRQARRSGQPAAPAICTALTDRLRAYYRESSRLKKWADAARDAFWHPGKSLEQFAAENL